MCTRDEFLAIVTKEESIQFHAIDDDYWLYASSDGYGWMLEIIDAGMVCLAQDLDEAMDCVEDIGGFDNVEIIDTTSSEGDCHE